MSCNTLDENEECVICSETLVPNLCSRLDALSYVPLTDFN